MIDCPNGPKVYHANLLKRYYRRASVNFAEILDDCSSGADCIPEEATIADDDELACYTDAEDEYAGLPVTPDGQSDIIDQKAQINPNITNEQKDSLLGLLDEYGDIFSETPGCTSTVEHDIVLTSTSRVQAKIYPVPLHLKPYFEEEVNRLFEQGIIQRSSSQHCSPVVMVRKADGSYRMAIDYRQLNSITMFDAEPSCNIEEELYRFYGANYFSELDLCKAYYQVPLTERAKPLTAFPTHLGLMEFCCLPFGLVTACATYIRLMRVVLGNLPNVTFYFDNIFVYSADWEQYCSALKSVFERIRSHGLTL